MKKIIAIMIGCGLAMTIFGSDSTAYAQAPAKQPSVPFTGTTAQPAEEIGKQEITDPLATNSNSISLPTFDIRTSGIRWVLAALFFISTPLLFIMALYSGINMVIRPENEEVVAKSRRTLIFSALGLALMAFAYAIVQNVLNLF